MFSTAGNTHQAWKDREAAQAAAGFYNDSSVDLTPRDSLEPCHICNGTGGQTYTERFESHGLTHRQRCIAGNGKGTVWVETITVSA